MNLSILRSIPRGIEPADQMAQQLFSGGISWVIWIRLLQGGQEIAPSLSTFSLKDEKKLYF